MANRSPDLTPLDYFMWGMMYGTPVTSEKNLFARVHGANESLTKPLHLLGHVRESQHCRCRVCNDVGGTQFEPRLYCSLLDVLHMFGLLTKCGTGTSMLYRAHTVRFRTEVPSSNIICLPSCTTY